MTGGDDNKRVVVAMSGGVDSSVAAHLLKEAGYECTGVFMRSGVGEADDGAGGAKRCCSAVDAADARRVATALGIPFYVADFGPQFDSLIEYFCGEYGRGRTPNPCIVCNRDLKFGRLFEYADMLGARYVATGHYARIENEGSRWHLKRGADGDKDQSYVLFPILRERLERVLLPMGNMKKSETRGIARDLGLAVHQKPESQEVCFVTHSPMELIRARHPELVRPGPILDVEGNKVGRHTGIVGYTVGQRKGIGRGTGPGVPRYVVAIRADENAIVVGSREDLLFAGLAASGVNWLASLPGGPMHGEVQIRYRHKPVPATISPDGPDSVRVEFDEPQSAPAPGQAVVFYDGDCVLGGGWIDRAIPR
ncbi:MAG: tRNA 2-thiouridine(34) synthase MnmA [Phycisphaerae bacterium]|nr:tRNA 2-thiouridine(34) synthase MnmA [Phycisphaerae bacterium]